MVTRLFGDCHSFVQHSRSQHRFEWFFEYIHDPWLDLVAVKRDIEHCRSCESYDLLRNVLDTCTWSWLASHASKALLSSMAEKRSGSANQIWSTFPCPSHRQRTVHGLYIYPLNLMHRINTSSYDELPPPEEPVPQSHQYSTLTGCTWLSSLSSTNL